MIDWEDFFEDIDMDSMSPMERENTISLLEKTRLYFRPLQYPENMHEEYLTNLLIHSCRKNFIVNFFEVNDYGSRIRLDAIHFRTLAYNKKSITSKNIEIDEAFSFIDICGGDIYFDKNEIILEKIKKEIMRRSLGGHDKLLNFLLVDNNLLNTDLNVYKIQDGVRSLKKIGLETDVIIVTADKEE